MMVNDLMIKSEKYWSQKMIRAWVDTEDMGGLIHSLKQFPNESHLGMRVLDEKNRIIYVQTKIGYKELYVNKTCMRTIEVIILDEAIRKLI